MTSNIVSLPHSRRRYRHPNQSFDFIQQNHPGVWTGRTRSWVNDLSMNENDNDTPNPNRSNKLKSPFIQKSARGTKRKALNIIQNMSTEETQETAAKRPRGRPPKVVQPPIAIPKDTRECDKKISLA